jgi:hypothetical protein
MYNDNVEYASQRLTGTIVRVGEVPVYVSSVTKTRQEGIICKIHDLQEPDADGDGKFVSVDTLNLKPVPLGYINYGVSCYYLVRKPMRNDWRQGLRRGNSAFVGEEGFFELPYQELSQTILGKYPKVRDALALVETRRKDKVAFSRDFAVGHYKTLHYKGRCVGTFDKQPALDKKYFYLNEYLQETLDAQDN